MKKSTLIIVNITIILSAIISHAQSSKNGMRKLVFDSEISENKAIHKFLSVNNLSEDNTFRLIRTTTDRMGITHSRYQQYYKGIKVEFGTLITHKQGEVVSSVNAEVYDASRLNLSPVLNDISSLQKAVDHMQITKASWYDNTTKKISQKRPESELVIVPDYSDGLRSVVLAYKFEISASKPNIKGFSYINAKDGGSVLFNPLMKHYNRNLGNSKKTGEISQKARNTANMLVAGSADTRYIGPRSIETRAESNGTYTLNDDINGIFTKDALNGSEDTQPYYTTFGEFIDNDNNWTSAEFGNSDFDDAALDAHYGASKVNEYWATIHDRDSFDDNGAAIFSYVHVGVNYFNAFWDGRAMSYGDGNSNPLTTFDICAHEIGHAVTSNTANLVYANQSGGLNEGYSDIWAAAIQHYTYGTGTDTTPDIDTWQIGEDIGAIRSMSNPKTFGDPDTYLGTNWRPTGDESDCVPSRLNDFCGVHSNSGVLNHWFHILVAGKTGENDAGDMYDVAGVGMAKAEEIAYLVLRDYLTPNATFLEARNASMIVANNLYSCNSDEVKEVQNAWYAVNVGEEFVAADDDVALQSITGETINLGCSTFSFSPLVTVANNGINAITSIDISYTIDGGTPVNENFTTSIASCETATYTINSIGELSRGAHTMIITTTTINDGRPENNTKPTTIIVNDNDTTNSLNSFEEESDVLISYNEGSINESLWERGVPAGILLQDASNNVYGTNLTGNHPDNTKAYLVSQCYDLSIMTDPVLKFKMAFDLEVNWDIVYMEYSVDQGTNWAVLGSAIDPDWYNSDRTNASSGAANDCQNCPGAQWTGQGETINNNGVTNATLQGYSYSLSAFDSDSPSPATNIIFRFTFHSDQAVNEEGVIIDDFGIEGETTLSVNENIFDQFSYFPNPSNGTLQVTLIPKGFEENISISIYDLSGRSVYTNSFEPTTNFTTNLNLESLNRGIYVMDIKQGKNNQYAKIIMN